MPTTEEGSFKTTDGIKLYTKTWKVCTLFCPPVVPTLTTLPTA